jgi:hypothetical protein
VEKKSEIIEAGLSNGFAVHNLPPLSYLLDQTHMEIRLFAKLIYSPPGARFF